MSTREKRGAGQPTVVTTAGGSSGGSSPAASPAAPAPNSAASARPASGSASVVATLVAIEGDLQGQAFTLHAGDNHLGRGADCSPLLNSRWISRSHAHVRCERGQLALQATEGKEVFVNDAPANEKMLQDGDRIRLGTTVFLLRTVVGGDASISSVIPVKPAGSGARAVPAAAAKAAAGRVAVPAKRKRPFWRFWQKPTPALVFVRGERAGERIDLRKPRIRIGGLNENDIVIAGHDASRNHAELRVRDGRVHIWDLRSVNGTWVNEQRIENTELRFGDVIRIGSEELRFED